MSDTFDKLQKLSRELVKAVGRVGDIGWQGVEKKSLHYASENKKKSVEAVSLMELTDSEVLEYKVASAGKANSLQPLFFGPPPEFWKRDIPINNKRKTYARHHEEFLFYEIEQGSVLSLGELGDIFFDKGGRIIKEISSPYYPLIGFFEYLNFAKKHFSQKGLVFFDRFKQANFAHWLLDNVPRLIGRNNDEKVITRPISNKWQLQILAAYGIEKEQLVETLDFSINSFGSLRIPSYGVRNVPHPASKANPVVLNFIRSDNHKNHKPVESSSIIFVYRQDERKVHGLEAMYDFFLNKGFVCTIIDPGKIDFEHQVAFFKTADIVVGVHGASLALAIFMKKNSLLIEFLPKSFGNPAFWMIGSTLGVKHIFVTKIKSTNLGKKPQYRGGILSEDDALELCNLILKEMEAK